MKIKANIWIQFKDIPLLYQWLDNHAEGWVMWADTHGGEISLERTRQLVSLNLKWLEENLAKDKGEKFTSFSFVLPNERAAMFCKLAWIGAEIEYPKSMVNSCSV